MDLDDFEATVAPGDDLAATKIAGAADAVRAFDACWYSARSRAARWMDLIGDYAGMERFVIDGDALVQRVLDDPLLGLAKDGELSFQLLHATHSLEKLLRSFIDRKAVFDVVFWESNRHMTTRCAGSDENAVASAALARTLLARHLHSHLKNEISVHIFSDLQDPGWIDYVSKTKPMFILTSDGGKLATSGDEVKAACVLTQRQHVFQLLCFGITVSILRDTEFRQTKIFSFVFEGRRELNPKSLLSPASLWTAFKNASNQVNSASYPSLTSQELSEGRLESGGTLDALLSDCVTNLHADGGLESVDDALVCVFVTHIILLHMGLPLELRSISDVGRDAKELLHPELSACLLQLLPRVFCTLHTLLVAARPGVPGPDVDFRVFGALLSFVNAESAGGTVSLESICGSTIYGRLCAIYQDSGRSPPSLDPLRAFPRVATQPRVVAEMPVVGVLPFENPMLDTEIGDLVVDTHASDVEPGFVTRLNPGTVYNDVHHWHNQLSILPHHQGGDARPESAEWLRRKALKRDQRFMAKFQKFAESLAGASSVGLQQQTISSVTARGSRLIDDARSTASTRASSPTFSRPTSPIISRPNSPALSAGRPGTPGKGKKPKPPTKKEALLQQIQAQKASTRLSDSQKWWSDQLSQIEALSSVRDRLVLAQNLAKNKRVSGPDADATIALEYRLYRMHLDLQLWIADLAQKDLEVHDSYAIRLVRDAVAAYKLPGHSVATLAALDSLMTSLGFAAYLPSLHISAAASAAAEDRSMTFKFEKLLKSSKSASPLYKWMRVPDGDPVLWQLRVFGEFMDRSMDSRPDRRVPFEPDAWQREVLDALDANESILVVAPTSAGKTFISFYAMEQVLRASDDGILVYVAPTKALVNQIAADVHARFRKTSRSGKNFWAIHSRDYRVNDPQSCQVLVTVPEILSTMLLSPSLAKLWTPRIKRIIMDEIHTIGEQESGPVWEQILLLAPCPVIGLSATVGDPETFNSWLASVQRAHGFKHTFIHHRHRYSHLRKHIYLLGHAPSEFSGLDSYRTTDRLRFLHPITMIGWGMTNLPSDFALESRDTLHLYGALLEHKARLPHTVAAELTRLYPSNFFSSEHPQFLKQKDILRYEEELFRLLRPVLVEHSEQPVGSVLQQISSHLTDPVVARESARVDLNLTPTPADFLQNLIHLVADLHKADDLPAILFSFDRHHCEVMGKTLLERLEAAEALWKGTSPVWAQKIRDWQLWESRAKERERAQLRLAKMKPKRDEEEGARDPSRNTSEASWEASFNPDEPLEQFSFSGGNAAYLKSELEQDIKDLSWSSVPTWALRALQRGIGVHHSGMNKGYRSLVERLFRLKFVRVMISTGTLALGINAPARTTVFCGDSPYLTALMYRQCAGRAGRRGFDLLGNVVFYGLPMDRIQRLVLSRLPPLSGNFPLTSTLVLRLCNLLEGSGRAPTAVRAVRSILQLPQVAYGSPVGHEQLMHHIRFSIDYLRRVQLLDESGRPLNLFGISARLYYTEPSNLALVVLLQSGVVHRICNQASTLAAKQELMLVLCHLFGRRYSPSTTTIPPKSASRVVLPPLPKDARDVLAVHSRMIVDIFSSYAHTYAKHHANKIRATSTQLPLSKRTFDSAPEDSPFMTYLRKRTSDLVVRCPFVATSGHGDTFSSATELTHAARDGLHMNAQAIPSMDMFLQHSAVRSKDRHTGQPQLNAYLLDFYTHGQADALVHENGIRRGDMWYALDDFSLSLRTVQATLVEMLEATAAGKSSASPPQSPKSPAPAILRDDKDWDATETPGGATSPQIDAGDDDDEGPIALGAKPATLGKEDWRVLEVVSEVVKEFDTTFRKIWA
ncbi:P-loop containing nucleoside triphosphate hydrolase protein [Auricularia subglabra TFB-10046 SS5]|nr:P-loop containing nucleoside triphosphate hydrolase protein [Auricularia subglabra TFB-10046 SS5]